MFLFCLLDDRIASPSSVCLCFVEENSPLLKQLLPEVEGFPDSWHDVTTHSETKTYPDWTDTRSSSLGVAEAGTLKLVLQALKCQNSIFFLEYLLTHYRATITIKILLAMQTLKLKLENHTFGLSVVFIRLSEIRFLIHISIRKLTIKAKLHDFSTTSCHHYQIWNVKTLRNWEEFKQI